MKLFKTSRTRSGLVKVTLAMPATSMPCTDNNTIWARRQVTTDPNERRTIRSSLLPSSLLTSLTRKPSLDTTTSDLTGLCQTRMIDQHLGVVD